MRVFREPQTDREDKLTRGFWAAPKHAFCPLFSGSSQLLQHGFCLAETGLLCLFSEKPVRWWARYHQQGKASDSGMCQKYLQCHGRVDERVHTADKKGCREMVASPNKRTGLQNFRSRCEYSEGFWEGREEGLRTWTPGSACPSSSKLFRVWPWTEWLTLCFSFLICYGQC